MLDNRFLKFQPDKILSEIAGKTPWIIFWAHAHQGVESLEADPFDKVEGSLWVCSIFNFDTQSLGYAIPLIFSDNWPLKSYKFAQLLEIYDAIYYLGNVVQYLQAHLQLPIEAL